MRLINDYGVIEMSLRHERNRSNEPERNEIDK